MSNDKEGFSDDEKFMESLRPFLDDDVANRFLETKRLIDARDRTGLIKLG